MMARRLRPPDGLSVKKLLLWVVVKRLTNYENTLSLPSQLRLATIVIRLQTLPKRNGGSCLVVGK